MRMLRLQALCATLCFDAGVDVAFVGMWDDVGLCSQAGILLWSVHFLECSYSDPAHHVRSSLVLLRLVVTHLELSHQAALHLGCSSTGVSCYRPDLQKIYIIS
jgi:hypothetical protein